MMTKSAREIKRDFHRDMVSYHENERKKQDLPKLIDIFFIPDGYHDFAASYHRFMESVYVLVDKTKEYMKQRGLDHA